MTEKNSDDYRKIWHEKPVLRRIYTDFYRRIISASRSGRTLEIGGGSGNLKSFSSDVISTDIVPEGWLDAAADAQALPFAAGSFANIVAVDVLHHIERPRRFLAEVDRVLQPGGRLILLEPAITPVSRLFYHLFHPEPVILDADPLAAGPLSPDRDPFDANQAIPTLLFGRFRKQLQQAFPGLDIVHLERLGLFAYPLSGGFRPWCLLPGSCVGILLRLEQRVTPLVGWLMAFRLFVVMQKAGKGCHAREPVKESQ